MFDNTCMSTMLPHKHDVPRRPEVVITKSQEIDSRQIFSSCTLDFHIKIKKYGKWTPPNMYIYTTAVVLSVDWLVLH